MPLMDLPGWLADQVNIYTVCLSRSSASSGFYYLRKRGVFFFPAEVIKKGNNLIKNLGTRRQQIHHLLHQLAGRRSRGVESVCGRCLDVFVPFYPQYVLESSDLAEMAIWQIQGLTLMFYHVLSLVAGSELGLSGLRGQTG